MQIMKRQLLHVEITSSDRKPTRSHSMISWMLNYIKLRSATLNSKHKLMWYSHSKEGIKS